MRAEVQQLGHRIQWFALFELPSYSVVYESGLSTYSSLSCRSPSLIANTPPPVVNEVILEELEMLRALKDGEFVVSMFSGDCVSFIRDLSAATVFWE